MHVDNSVDKTVLPKNSWVCPSCFLSLEKANKLRRDLYDLESIEGLEQLKESGQLIS